MLLKKCNMIKLELASSMGVSIVGLFGYAYPLANIKGAASLFLTLPAHSHRSPHIAFSLPPP